MEGQMHKVQKNSPLMKLSPRTVWWIVVLPIVLLVLVLALRGA